MQRRISFAQRRRLEAIELAVYWTGEICRSSVMQAFNVTKNHITKDLSCYKEVAGDNIDYDLGRRRYRARSTFRPVFSSNDATDYLDLLSLSISGRGGVSALAQTCAVTADALPLPAPISLDSTLPVVTRSIKDGAGICIKYRSLNRDHPTTKTIFPRALFQTGRAWAMRGYDLEAGEFRDFILARIVQAEPLDDLEIDVIPDEDEAWESVVDVKVVPGDKLTPERAEVVADEYGMLGPAGKRVWIARMRTVLVPYFLDYHDLRPNESGNGLRLLGLANWDQISQHDRKNK